MPICINCFEQLEQYPCRHCGHQPDSRRSSLLLPQGTLLREQYMVGKLLGNPGGFGITYLGYHQKLDCKLAIKEFLPRELAGRSLDGHTVELHSEKDEPVFQAGLQQFLREARLLAKFDHPNIVRVIDFFEENSTAYLVMEYYSGVTLVNYVEQHGGRLDEHAALDILLPIFEGLQEVHARGVLHRDIKPQNIYITDKGRPILLDFGAARHTVESMTQGYTMLVSPGFAPIEQYDRQGKQGPWTDVYGCAATLYYMLSGNLPPDSVSRLANDSFRPSAEVEASSEVRRALELGLALQPQNRLQSVADFRRYLIDEYRLPDADRTQLLYSPAQTEKLPAGRTVAMNGFETAEFTQHQAEEFKRAGLSQSHELLQTKLQQPEAAADKNKLDAVPRYLSKNLVIAIALILALGAGTLLYQQFYSPAKRLSQRGIVQSEQAFIQAVRSNDLEAVKLFLSAGYSPNQLESGGGMTAVLAAVDAGHYPMVKYLLDKGGRIDVKDRQGRSPLDIAIEQGNTNILKLLMEHNQLSPDSKDGTGKSLFEKAIALGSVSSVQYLINQGANLQAQDSAGKTLLDLAVAAGNQQIVQLLRTAGVKRNINLQYISGDLNKVELPPGETASFEIDLLGNGIGQKISVRRQGGRGNVVIAQDERNLAVYDNLKGNWYVAFLRDDQTPDLVYFSLVGADFIEEVKIIGKTAGDTVGTLFSPDLGALRSMGLLRGQAGIRLEGRRLILNSGKNQAVVEWDEQQQKYRMRKL